MRTKEWVIRNSDSSKPVLERLLQVRNIKTEDAAREFLHPLEITLIHPNAFTDMPKAVERVAKAIDEGENILIMGDFDADGVTSTSILLKTFEYLGAHADYYIPNRESEGHGLNTASLVKLLSQKKPKLIITVDNGISNVEEVKFINSFGKDVIITDHHEAPEIMPDAFAILNPKAMNSLDEKLTTSQIESLTSLAGVGVAFKLVQGILEHYNKIEYSLELLPYVTVGTVADIVPLIGENRYYVARGLELISQGKHYGLKRMLDMAGVNCENGVTSEQIAFTVAPRVNASGRLDSIDAAIKFLISDNKKEVEFAIVTLENYNKLRQDLCLNTFLEADDIWRASGMRDNAIVIFNPSWHIGIIGIVASKFVEKYYKPAFIMTYSPETKQFRCSARGVKELNIYEIITNISEYLEGFGGHKFAGGFTFEGDEAKFNTVKKALNQTVDEMLNGQTLAPSLDIDLELESKDITVELVEDVNKLEPFGASNPPPLFVLKDMVLKQKKLMGSTKEHLKLIIETPDGFKDCIWWSRGDIPLIAGDKIDIAFSPQLNTFNNMTDIQLIIKDIHSEAFKEEEKSKVKVFDHRNKTDILRQVNDYIKTSKLGVSVFAEDRKIVEALKPYEYITKSIVTRQNAQKNDVLMFFDYPCTEDVYNNLKQAVSPTCLHYMSYSDEKFDGERILKDFASMIRYSCNNLEGRFLLVRAASALGVTEEIVETLLEIFEDCGMIKILSESGDSYVVDFVAGVEISKALHTPKYAEFAELMNTICEYKNSFMTAELV